MVFTKVNKFSSSSVFGINNEDIFITHNFNSQLPVSIKSLRLPIGFLQLNLNAEAKAVIHTHRWHTHTHTHTHRHRYTRANKYHYATDGWMGWCFCRNSRGILEPDVWSCQGLVIGMGVSHIPGVPTHTHTHTHTVNVIVHPSALLCTHAHTDECDLMCCSTCKWTPLFSSMKIYSWTEVDVGLWLCTFTMQRSVHICFPSDTRLTFLRQRRGWAGKTKQEGQHLVLAWFNY